MDPLHASIHYNTFLFVLAFNLVSSSLIKSLAFKKIIIKRSKTRLLSDTCNEMVKIKEIKSVRN